MERERWMGMGRDETGWKEMGMGMERDGGGDGDGKGWRKG